MLPTIQPLIRRYHQTLDKSQSEALLADTDYWQYPYDAELRLVQFFSKLLGKYLDPDRASSVYKSEGYVGLNRYLKSVYYELYSQFYGDSKTTEEFFTALLVYLWNSKQEQYTQFVQSNSGGLAEMPGMVNPLKLDLFGVLIASLLADFNSYSALALNKALAGESVLIAKVLNTFLVVRAPLVLRNFVGNQNSFLERFVSQALDLDFYSWVTMGDEKVRHIHSTLDHKICLWSDPTVYSEDGVLFVPRTSDMEIGKAPGEATNCRCGAAPYIGNLLFSS